MRPVLAAALLLCAAPLFAQTPEDSRSEPRLRFTLSGTLTTGQSTTDWAFLRFLPDALPGWDQHDASKYSSSPAQIAFSGRRDRQRVRLGMDSRPDGTLAPLRHSFNVKMETTTTTEGTFTLSWDGALSPGWRATLVDRTTGERVKMWRETSYSFQMKPVQWTNRFLIRIRPASDPVAVSPEPLAPEASLLTATGQIGEAYPNPASGESRIEVVLGAEQVVRVAVYDALGREVAVAHDGPLASGASVVALPVHALAQGTYAVRIAGENLRETRRLTVVR